MMAEIATRRRALLLLVPLAVAALYLLAARAIAGTLAFPLDDAWIHQSYARTVAHHGEWAFLPGAPSSGSTSPLWTLLLVPGHWLPLAPTHWGYLVGVVAWLGIVVAGARLSVTLFSSRPLAVATALALGLEWHLAWAALSGMEIPLYALLVLLLLLLYIERWGGPLVWGLVGGALTLARPEGMLLLGLIGVHDLLSHRDAPGRMLRRAVAIGAGWLVVVTPLLIFNWRVSGLIFPNTFYAKQQEYAILTRDLPLWRRLVSLGWQPWIGGQGFLLIALPLLGPRRLGGLRALPLLWAIGIVLLYALRLPVTYQHGRYLMPTIPIFVIYALAAFRLLLGRVTPLLRRPLIAAAATGFLGFALLGSGAYARDVALIECEMGTTARWIASHTPDGALIAAHDIGRLGYVAERPILDFAGLISPETIPIIRDEQALLDLAERRGARYLVTFEDWYPTMIHDPRLAPRHTTNCPVTAALGGEPMSVYELVPRAAR